VILLIICVRLCTLFGGLQAGAAGLSLRRWRGRMLSKHVSPGLRRGTRIWCGEEAHMALDMIEPVVVAAYVEKLLRTNNRNQLSSSTLAAIRMMFDWMVTGGCQRRTNLSRFLRTKMSLV
jgi:hypothetical protein